MKTPVRSLLSLSFFALGLISTRAQAPAPSGYKVVVEITFDETGKAEDGKIVSSNDPSGELLLNQIAMNLAAEVKQPPRLDAAGQPVKFKARAPFNFPVADDEGPAANDAPKPSLQAAPKPVYPPELAAAGVVGGAIVELNITADGRVDKATILRSSHPEFANAVHTGVLQWKFTPAQQDGAPVASRWRIAVSFSVEGKVPDWIWRVAPRPSLGGFTVVRPKLPAAESVPAEQK